MSEYNRNPYQLRDLLQPSGSRPGYTDTSPNINNQRMVDRNDAVVLTTAPMGRKTKRHRTTFDTNQINALEEEYVKNRYLDSNRRSDLASKLNLGERTIKVWFQNRRMKEKKDKAENMQNCIALNDCFSPPNNPTSLPGPVLQADDMHNGQQYQGWVPDSQPQIYEPYYVTSPYYPVGPSNQTYNTPYIPPLPYQYPQEQQMVCNYMNVDNDSSVTPGQQPSSTSHTNSSSDLSWIINLMN